MYYHFVSKQHLSYEIGLVTWYDIPEQQMQYFSCISSFLKAFRRHYINTIGFGSTLHMKKEVEGSKLWILFPI